MKTIFGNLRNLVTSKNETPSPPERAAGDSLFLRERARARGNNASELAADARTYEPRVNRQSGTSLQRVENLKSPSRRSRGKVGRLPTQIRETVNIMLTDGASYPVIVERLATLGYPGFTPHNISRWKLRGHQRWLETQEKFDLEKLRAEMTREAVKDFKDPSALHDASEILAARTMFRALSEMSSRSAEELLSDPSFFRLSRISSHQLAERTRRERLQARNELTEAEFIDQLAADPEKLNRVLTELRARCSAPPALAVNRA